MNGPDQQSVELFFQEASENLQYLREYSGLLQEPQTKPEDLEKLYIAAHSLAGTSASYGFPQFSEVAAKMAHIFHYAMNATLTPDMHGPLTEFISDAISVLEFDLLADQLRRDRNGGRYRRVQAALCVRFSSGSGSEPQTKLRKTRHMGDAPDAERRTKCRHSRTRLPEDGEVPEEVLEFFIPEAEEHLQAVTECLLTLEAAPERRRNSSPVPLHAHGERLSGTGWFAPSFRGRAPCGGSYRATSRRCFATECGNRGYLPRIGGCAEEAAAPAMDERYRDGCRGGSSIGANLRACSGSRRGRSTAETAASTTETDAQETTTKTVAPRAASQPLPQAKSVRISLERLDRMMNAVGELVINRTRMLGRLSELSKLVEVLTFSKGPTCRQSLRIPRKARIQSLACGIGAGKSAATDGHVSVAASSPNRRSCRTICSSSASSKWIATTM